MGAAPEPSSAAPPKDAAASAFLADCISHTARMLNSLFADASTAREFVDRGGAPSSVLRTVFRVFACVHIQHKPCMFRMLAQSPCIDYKVWFLGNLCLLVGSTARETQPACLRGRTDKQPMAFWNHMLHVGMRGKATHEGGAESMLSRVRILAIT